MNSAEQASPGTRISGGLPAAGAAISSPRVLVANPGAAVLAEGTRIIVGYGLDANGVSRTRQALQLPDPAPSLGNIVAEQEEATMVLADAAGPLGPTLHAWRGAGSAFDIYLSETDPDQIPVISDHFRNALAAIPAHRRQVQENGVADHLLFGTVPGTGTYVHGIARVGHGEHIRWSGGHTQRGCFDRLVAQPSGEEPSLDAIDSALARAMERICAAENCASQLSGGVDSSLLQTYLPASMPTVSGSIDSPEFSRETHYAEQASRLLGTRHRVFSAQERQFQTMVVDLVRLVGLPIRMPQSVVFQLTFRSEAAHFINGEYADTLFGLKPALHYATAYDQRHWLAVADRLGLARLLPSAKSRGLRSRIERLRRLERAVDDWRGLGARHAIYSNLPLAERILGSEQIRRRIEARVAYTAQRFQSTEQDPNPLFAHIEFGHMLAFHCADGASRWRQLAHAYDKNLLIPFLSRSVIAAALAIPRRRRYIANGRVKYLLKDVLRRREPRFGVDARKFGGDLPFARYLKSGPLMQAFDRYAMPDMVDRVTADASRAAPDWLTWNLLTFAIWRDEVLKDPDLALLPNTRILSPPISAA